MPAKKVVFLGTADQLYHLAGFQVIFDQNGWQVETCETIEEAQEQGNIDVLIVWAYGSFYVEQYNAWKKHPKAIWYKFANGDKAPHGVKTVRHATLPEVLYREALALCK